MKIQFIGAAQTVTGSQHLITIGDKRILFDTGLFQGHRSEMYEKNQNFPFEASTIDALILSHAHLDHSGNIPNLVKQGFKGPIYSTPPTRDLCGLLLRDSAYLQEMDVRWLNKIRAKSKKSFLEPLYTLEDAEESMTNFHTIDYGDPTEILPGIHLTFRDAGHILGSASVLLEFKERGHDVRLGFTGDLGRYNRVVIRDPVPLQDLDILLTESTYGNRHHGESDDIAEELAQTIISVAEKGGKIIIPAFAVGRTQHLVYYLHKLFDQGRIPDLPIFVDSPLASKATEVFRRYPDYLDRETGRIYLEGKIDPFGFSRLTYVRRAEDSKALNSLNYPHIIISASGMAEGGRILHHLANNIENSKNLILFVGYAAKNTLARRIMDGEPKVKIFGEEHTVKAQIKSMDCFSAHGDRRDILEYVKHSSPERLKHLFLVHGEAEQAESLIDAFRSQGYHNIYFPHPMSSYEINF